MKAYFLRLGWILAAAAVAAAGCGGNSSDGGDGGSDGSVTDAEAAPEIEAGPSDSGGPDDDPPPFSTGLEGGAPLGDLSPDDFEKVCKELDEYYEAHFSPVALKPMLCNLTGVLAVVELVSGSEGVPSITELRSTCSGAKDACLLVSADAAADRLGLGGFDIECEQPDPSCDVTVGELETCANDLRELKDRLARTVPACEQLSLTTLLILASGFEEPTAPESCERMDRCEDPAPSQPGDAASDANSAGPG